jgi:hypothetical protein
MTIGTAPGGRQFDRRRPAQLTSSHRTPNGCIARAMITAEKRDDCSTDSDW